MNLRGPPVSVWRAAQLAFPVVLISVATVIAPPIETQGADKLCSADGTYSVELVQASGAEPGANSTLVLSKRKATL